MNFTYAQLCDSAKSSWDSAAKLALIKFRNRETGRERSNDEWGRWAHSKTVSARKRVGKRDAFTRAIKSLRPGEEIWWMWCRLSTAELGGEKFNSIQGEWEKWSRNKVMSWSRLVTKGQQGESPLPESWT